MAEQSEKEHDTLKGPLVIGQPNPGRNTRRNIVGDWEIFNRWQKSRERWRTKINDTSS